jgi:hypothetical protein
VQKRSWRSGLGKATPARASDARDNLAGGRQLAWSLFQAVFGTVEVGKRGRPAGGETIVQQVEGAAGHGLVLIQISTTIAP